METITWALTISCIFGAYLNAKASIIGFYIWIPANIAWSIIALLDKQYAQAALFVVYTFIAALGIITWKASSKDAERKSNG